MIHDLASLVCLTLKQLEMHGCVFSATAIDGLLLKHQAINIHGVDQVFIALK